ncbi:hypothetical protein LQ318_12085 [Aliifodinibius salicampi]|uniref:Uncharacterized protein n=1 Tax=Fodinibius salicampi TaxID=1920655 RepID=A0ABT3Q0S3_9BACT|nr:hypothetical protein [Fodinibius salicampi]MCW9713641.1 hypothetical protein [Fodinibius salicampi]
MLSRSSKIKSSSAVQSPGKVQYVQEYLSDVHAPTDFPSIEEEKGSHGKDHSSSSEKEAQGQSPSNDSPDLELLVPRKNFQELFNRFFVLGHKQLLMLQTKIRKPKDPNNHSALVLGDIDNQKVQALRRHYYQLQMLLFNMSKGNNHSSRI